MTVAEALRIEIERHPLAAKFKKAGLRYIDVAAYCGISISYLSHILAGYRKPTERLEEKLQELSAKIDKLEAASRENYCE